MTTPAEGRPWNREAGHRCEELHACQSTHPKSKMPNAPTVRGRGCCPAAWPEIGAGSHRRTEAVHPSEPAVSPRFPATTEPLAAAILQRGRHSLRGAVRGRFCEAATTPGPPLHPPGGLSVSILAGRPSLPWPLQVYAASPALNSWSPQRFSDRLASHLGAPRGSSPGSRTPLRPSGHSRPDQDASLAQWQSSAFVKRRSGVRIPELAFPIPPP